MFFLARPSYGMVSHSIALPQVERKNAFASPGLFGLPMISRGFFKLKDFIIAIISSLHAVAVKATTGTPGKVVQSIANLE